MMKKKYSEVKQGEYFYLSSNARVYLKAYMNGKYWDVAVIHDINRMVGQGTYGERPDSTVFTCDAQGNDIPEPKLYLKDLQPKDTFIFADSFSPATVFTVVKPPESLRVARQVWVVDQAMNLQVFAATQQEVIPA